MKTKTVVQLSRRTALLLTLTIIVGLAHHTDHVLRVDHSGWPFRPDVNPFTYSLLLYPIFFFARLGPARFFWARWSLLLVGTAFTLYAHTMIETPQMQYLMWANGCSSDPVYQGVRNLLNTRSRAVGAIAVGLAMSVNVLLVASTISMLMDRIRASRPREVGYN